MKIPNANHAVIAPEKLCDYLLNLEHRRGNTKARLLLSLGYQRENWSLLEQDLRERHLSQEYAECTSNPFGVRYRIVAPIATPSGRTVSFCSIWQIDSGTDAPRFITMYPE